MVRYVRLLRLLDAVADTVDGRQGIQLGVVYKITNLEAATVLGVSGDDNRSLIGYDDDGSNSRQVGLLPLRLSSRAIMRG